MISPFDQAEAQIDLAEVMPLEFESLDEPETQAVEEMQAELRAVWEGRVVELEKQIEERERNARFALDAARHEAEEERLRVVASAEERVAEAQRQVKATVEAFAGERERYFAAVEREVVQLALAIAERVLHREAAMDPLLLRAAVRVALERVVGDGIVTLRVAAGGAVLWRSALDATQRDNVVELVEDPQLVHGDAVLETPVGRVDLGVREQLKEIERGFFDLLAARPAR